LALVGRGERVWLPELHGAILPDRGGNVHVPLQVPDEPSTGEGSRSARR
jgi:hypothetical protein